MAEKQMTVLEAIIEEVSLELYHNLMSSNPIDSSLLI